MNWIVIENEESFWETTFLRTSLRWNLFWKLRDGPECEARKCDHSENVEWKEIQLVSSVTKRTLTREVREKNVIAWRPRVDVTLSSMAWKAIETAKNLVKKDEKKKTKLKEVQQKKCPSDAWCISRIFRWKTVPWFVMLAYSECRELCRREYCFRNKKRIQSKYINFWVLIYVDPTGSAVTTWTDYRNKQREVVLAENNG